MVQPQKNPKYLQNQKGSTHGWHRVWTRKSMFLEFEEMIEMCIAKFYRNHYRKKSNLKTQETITKCLKRFDMRLFELIGGKVTGKG